MGELKSRALGIDLEEGGIHAENGIDNEFRLEELELKRLDNSIKREEIEVKKQDRLARKEYANKIFVMLVSFLRIVIGIVGCSATACLCFELSDTVLVALLTTSSANVIGIFLVVVRYLFNPRTKKDEPDK
jgi:hypothetical protein